MTQLLTQVPSLLVQVVGTADAVLTTSTASDIEDFAQLTIPKGVTIFGNFTAVDLRFRQGNCLQNL